MGSRSGRKTCFHPARPGAFGVLHSVKKFLRHQARASYFVATYLLGSSPYDVYFVNPRASEILGRPAYASLADLPVVPDIVDVFRRHDDLPDVAQEAVDVGAQTLWLQLGSWHEGAATLAAEAVDWSDAAPARRAQTSHLSILEDHHGQP